MRGHHRADLGVDRVEPVGGVGAGQREEHVLDAAQHPAGLLQLDDGVGKTRGFGVADNRRDLGLVDCHALFEGGEIILLADLREIGGQERQRAILGEISAALRNGDRSLGLRAGSHAIHAISSGGAAGQKGGGGGRGQYLGLHNSLQLNAHSRRQRSRECQAIRLARLNRGLPANARAEAGAVRVRQSGQAVGFRQSGSGSRVQAVGFRQAGQAKR